MTDVVVLRLLVAILERLLFVSDSSDDRADQFLISDAKQLIACTPASGDDFRLCRPTGGLGGKFPHKYKLDGVAMYIMCPNEWSKVYHLAEPVPKFPGRYQSWCAVGGYLAGTRLEHYGDGHGRISQVMQPIAVEGIPTGRRLCKMCERLRLTRGSTVTAAPVDLAAPNVDDGAAAGEP